MRLAPFLYKCCIFVNSGNASQYAKSLLPATFEGNVYTKGTIRAVNLNKPMRFGEMGKDAQDQLKKYKEQAATEKTALVKDEFDAAAILTTQNDNFYLEINLDRNWKTVQPRKLVSTSSLRMAIVPNLPFENTDGSALKIDTDYFGKKRDITNPFPGPFEITASSKQKIKLW
ncbi:hypothetical protein G7074_19965 [Pedobacter sp. HDW13]|uniref:hypothetical protein n=1 Tax=unclassified Pedobacter TaxID=2628915 RepID=UPI000F5A95CF|nr:MULTISPECIES: hypothetical protein [unclassified Pedobacter]QIL41336.1 hypothetical protein G7074_19965 [Pedobacter sp. HDW13]RQO78131.1 hypothetical protein DBR40_09280 [Pedobacter sp. KBW01]